MKLPLQITARGFPLSDAVKSRIEEKAAKLDLFCDRVMGCKVTVDVPNARRHHGRLYNLKIDVTVPGRELVVSREADPDLDVAIRDAFDAAARQLEDFVRKRRGV